MTTDTSGKTAGHFDILDGFPPDVVAIAAIGTISRANYETTLIPLVEQRIKSEGKIKLYYEIGEGFAGYTAGAMWDDAKLGMMHLASFARIAIVTDVEWIRMGVKIFAPIVPGEVSLFHLAEREAAKAWIAENRHAPDAGPRVAADHKIPPAEDMGTPDVS